MVPVGSSATEPGTTSKSREKGEISGTPFEVWNITAKGGEEIGVFQGYTSEMGEEILLCARHRFGSLENTCR